MKSNPSIPTKTILLLAFILAFVNSASYTYTVCNSSAYLNSANLQCSPCLANQITNSYQTVATSCQCSVGFTMPTNAAACVTTGAACPTTNSFYNIFLADGSANAGAVTCTACSGTGIVNTNGSACTYCGPGMTFSATQGCICTNPTNVLTNLGCFQTTTSPTTTGSLYSTQLKYLMYACQTFTDVLSCSHIINLCAYSQGSTSTPECQFFTTHGLTSQLYANSAGFTLNPTTALSFKLVSYSSTGNYLGEKSLLLVDIMRCGTPSDSEVGITFGTNIQVNCQFNFNNLINQINSKKYQGRMYQLLVQGDTKAYYDVPVYMSLNSQPIRRFFLQDTYSYPNNINVLTGLTLELTFSGGVLITPKLTPTYTLLSTELGTGVVGGSPTQVVTYKVLFNSDLGSYWTSILVSFIIISIVALIHAIAKTYIGYLNRRSTLLFFINFAGVYSIWLFYYLLFVSGYWFLFTKTTTSPFLLLPPSDPILYPAFYTMVAVMVTFRLAYTLKDKSDKLATEVYLINWERGQFRNSWREIFIVNSLAQFYTYRTFSLFWMLAVLLFFMTGIGWQDLAAQTTSASASFFKTLTPQNRILLYFMSSAIFFAIGIIFKILRRASVLVWPYPFQDFVDYCTVTNISFFFVKKRLPHAYYLHASIPDRTDVTYREINQTIRRGLKKNRSVENQMSSIDSLRVYSVLLSKDMENKHTQMLKMMEDEENGQRIKFNKDSVKKNKINPRQDFTQNRLKPHIQGLVSRQNDQRRKSFFQRYCGPPPVDLRQEGGRGTSTVFYDDSLELVSEVFPNGNEFQEIHTLIVIFLGFVTLVNNCPVAAFLTYFVDQYLIGNWINWSCKGNLQEMTKVKKGFMI